MVNRVTRTHHKVVNVMSNYQFKCWKPADFHGLENLLEQTSKPGCINILPTQIGLAKDAVSFDCEIGQANSKFDQMVADLNRPVILHDEILIDGMQVPAGSQIIPDHIIRSDISAGTTMIVGRIVMFAREKSTEIHVVVSSCELVAGQMLPVASVEISNNAGPGTNCFARGTLIETPFGALPIEQLEDGDEVMTHDGQTQLISWIGSRRLSGLELVLNPNLRPVRIMAGALTGGRPGQDLTVSQNHRLLVDDWRAPLLFGEEEILAPAKSLLNNKNVYVDCPPGGIDYFHLLMDGHNLVCANGLWAESMLPDETTLSMLKPEQRRLVENSLGNTNIMRAETYRSILPALSPYGSDSIAA